MKELTDLNLWVRCQCLCHAVADTATDAKFRADPRIRDTGNTHDCRNVRVMDQHATMLTPKSGTDEANECDSSQDDMPSERISHRTSTAKCQEGLWKDVAHDRDKRFSLLAASPMIGLEAGLPVK